MLCSLQMREFLSKQGRQASKEVIEKAAKLAFLKSYPDVLEPGQPNKPAIENLLQTGMPCLCLIKPGACISLHTCAEILSLDLRISISQSRSVALTPSVPQPSYCSLASCPPKSLGQVQL